jgi:preprotein translocase subunit SecD
MRLARRIEQADPLAGRLPAELRPPALPAGQVVAHHRTGRGRAGVAVVLAAVCLIAVLLVALLPRSDHQATKVLATYTAAPAPAGEVQRSAQVLRRRLDALDLRGVRVETGRGGATVRVSCGGCAPRTAAAVQRMAQPGRLLVYDWEPNLLDARCRTATDSAAAATSHRDAVLRAARCRAHPAGAAVVQDKASGQWYVLRDDPALGSADIVDPRDGVDRLAGNEPIVTFGFTPDGERAWRSLTRQVARRGQARLTPGRSPAQVFQHFAVVLDGRVIALPYIDFRQNPDGIDARAGGQIEGGFTRAGAAELAALLRFGELPARLSPAGP